MGARDYIYFNKIFGGEIWELRKNQEGVSCVKFGNHCLKTYNSKSTCQRNIACKLRKLKRCNLFSKLHFWSETFFCLADIWTQTYASFVGFHNIMMVRTHWNRMYMSYRIYVYICNMSSYKFHTSSYSDLPNQNVVCSNCDVIFCPAMKIAYISKICHHPKVNDFTTLIECWQSHSELRWLPC
jgi:hypothetical protein